MIVFSTEQHQDIKERRELIFKFINRNCTTLCCKNKQKTKQRKTPHKNNNFYNTEIWINENIIIYIVILRGIFNKLSVNKK